MSGRTDRSRTLRLLALLALLVLPPGLVAAQSADAPAGTRHESGVGSFLKGLWRGIAGGEKPPAEVPAAQASAPAAQAPDAAPGPAPSLARARWIGFTPVLAVAESAGDGAWLAGPFPEAGATGWVTDTISGLTTPVRLVWREAEPGSLAQLSAEAARGLGLVPGSVTNVAIYVAR